MKRLLKNGAIIILSSALVVTQISAVFADNTVSSGTQETTSEQESMTQNTPGDTGTHKPDSQPPEMPNGQKPEGEPPAKPDGQMPGGPGQMGEGAILNGAAAQTSAIHVTFDGSFTVKENGGYAFDNADDAAAFAKEYQNTSFTINEYYSIGQVANLVNDNGGNKISIELNGDAVWNVTGTSLISSLSIEDDAQVVIPENITLTVDGTEYSGCTLTADDF